MQDILYMSFLDLRESFRARWFYFYVLVFGGLVALLFFLGVTESQVMGFLGLGRLLITFIQICLAILPLFVLVTTVRSIVGDRESHVLEYWLSLPVSLGAYYWGKFLGRLIVVITPVLGALLGAACWGVFKGIAVPWNAVLVYGLLLISLCGCFLGLGFLISVITRRQEAALSLSFLLWLILLLFLDLILIGVMLQERFPVATIVGIALLNPMQGFRTAALLLFDPYLSVLGPTASVILDLFGSVGYILFAIVYPLMLGLGAAGLGYRLFLKGDRI